MPFVFTALVPHPPTLVENLAGESIKELSATREAFVHLSHELYAARPDILLILSPHGNLLPDAVGINTAPKFTGSLSIFGDHSTGHTYIGAIGFAHQIKEPLEIKYRISLVHQPDLDYGAYIPLRYLIKEQNSLPIVPMYPALFSLEDHFTIGKAVKDMLYATNKRIALVVTGDLAHRHEVPGKNGDRNAHEAARLFDARARKLLLSQDVKKLLNIPGEEIAESGSCLFRQLTLFLGMTEGIQYHIEELAYETSQGVGYTTLYYQPI